MRSTPFKLAFKALVRGADGRALVIRRAAGSRYWPNQWDLVGGKPEPGEAFDQTLVREALEETGLTIAIGATLGIARCSLPDLELEFHVMDARVLAGDVALSDEHSEARWVDDIELAQLELVTPIADALRLR